MDRHGGLWSAALALAGALVWGSAAGAATVTCTNPVNSTQWRVTWTTSSSPIGPLATVTALETRASGATTWSSAASSTWELRWDNAPGDWGDFVPAFHSVRGPLSTIDDNSVVTYLSPRLVAPDGSCDAYLYPFAQGQSTWDKVLVVGDSLTQQLNDPSYNQTYLQGYVQGNLNAHNLRAEVEGQGGRRWTPRGTGALNVADSYLLDEMRGLRATGNLRAIVVALGANDAGWVACGPIDANFHCQSGTDADRAARLQGVFDALTAIFQEIDGWGVCVVAVTAPDNLANYIDANPWHYANAAQSINNWLRYVAGLSSTDWFRVRDFAALSWDHHTWNADSWFIDDNLHLNGAGKLVYTSEIVNAALSCP
ncbi:MAG TPA: SGNH/GDSL hydrolase family protein [Candidatus Binatia bacterium]|nr:SGNH/GDSL hydrolase family protein [Candidatus Binatia bacterium]